MIIGILGFQGDVSEHIDILKQIKSSGKKEFEIKLVRSMGDLRDISGLIIPGGESTTIYKLIKEYSIYDEIVKMGLSGLPIMGTCAGLVILSKETDDERVKGMGLLDVEVRRNAYGRQIDSFIHELSVKDVGDFIGVFIRAPTIEKCGPNVEVLSYYNEKAVIVRNKNILGLTFHPELTSDASIHEYFLEIVEREGYSSTGE